MTEILFKEESYSIVGACFNVYKDKGCGFLEPVYHECCEIEFSFQDTVLVAARTRTHLSGSDSKAAVQTGLHLFPKDHCRAEGSLSARR
jgi:hypothetical protein